MRRNPPDRLGVPDVDGTAEGGWTVVATFAVVAVPCSVEEETGTGGMVGISGEETGVGGVCRDGEQRGLV